MKKSLLATTMIGGLSGVVLGVLPMAAMAQASGQSAPTPAPAATPPTATTPPAPKPPPKSESSQVGELVVTGSRIRHTTFNSPSPISVITTQDARDDGLLTVSQMLQKSTAAAGSVQINAQFGGYIVNGGPGVDTVSLRGLGDQRTLVLLNGRRLNPAGVGGTVAAVDLNVIPENMIDRYEILKDGASSVYGSDAIAGVVNIITKTNFNGLEVEADGYVPQGGAGQAYIVSADGGIVRDNFHIMFGAEHVDQTAVTQGDLPGGKCPLELQALPGSTTYNFGRTYANGAPFCAFEETNYVANLDTGGLFVYDPSQPASFPYVPYAASPFGANPRLTNIATEQRNTGIDAFSPSLRTSGYLNGGYDLTPSMQLYFEGLITNRESSVTYEPQFFPADDPTIIAASFSPFNPFPDYVQPILTLPIEKEVQDVTAGRALIGLKGDFGSKLPGWDWDIGGTFGENNGTNTITPQLTSKIDNALDAVPAPAGFNPTYSRVNPVDGIRYTCAINLTNPNEHCYPLDWFESSAQLAVDPALNYITSTDTEHTDYKQVVLDGHMDGPLFNLPAGPVQASVGGEFRYDYLDDVPGPEALADDYFNFTSSGITKGSESVTEGFGEVEVPVIKGQPLFESLTVNGSVRFTHHSLAGNHWTFKGSGNWQIIPAFRIRATYGTSFRGPELYENYLSSLIGFTGAADPCAMYGVNAAPTSNLYKNCASEGLAPTFIGYGATPEDVQEGAQGRLKPETSKNLTVGGILQPSFADLQIDLDYFHIEIDNEISQLGGANILDLCYESADFRSGSPYCSLVAPRDANNNIAYINDQFLNISQQISSGLDLDVLYRKELSFGRFTFHGEATYQLQNTQELFPGSGFIDEEGTFGFPRMVFNTDTRLKHGNWELTWSMTFLGHQQEYSLTGETPGGRYNLDQPSQLYHTLSLSYTGDKFRVEFGVRDIANAYPPVISNNPDTGYAPRVAEFANGYGNLELFGRTFFLNLKKSF